MTGLIWTMQIIHYPLFARVADLGGYETENIRITAWLVMPPMAVELVIAAALALRTPQQIPRGEAWAGLALVVAIWLSTFFFQAPRHVLLTHGADAQVISFLIATNWIRTIAWTARGGIALHMLERALP